MRYTYKAEHEERLDKFLVEVLQKPRNQIENLIENYGVFVDQKEVKKSGYKLKPNQTVVFVLPLEQEIRKSDFEDEEILRYSVEIIYEDEALLVINKPSGLVVHGAPSVSEPTLVDWLKLKRISLSTLSGEERHGIVHRLDKGTSGLLVVAKTNDAHTHLAKQLEEKTMGRYYLACIDIPLKENCIVEKPIGRDPKNRLKMGISESGRGAKTAFAKLDEILFDQKNKGELICAKLFTGRTHQIRVHLESIGRRILGDALYGFKGKDSKIDRIFLHAYSLYLIHPTTLLPCEFVCEIPQDMQILLEKNTTKGAFHETINPEFISSCFLNTSNWVRDGKKSYNPNK